MLRLALVLAGFFSTIAFASSRENRDLGCEDRVVVVPPHVANPILAADLAQFVIDHYTKTTVDRVGSSDCRPFLDYFDSMKEMDVLGFTANFQTAVNGIGGRQLKTLIQRTGATHLVEITTRSRGFAAGKPGEADTLDITVYKIDQESLQLVRVRRESLSLDLKKLSPAGTELSVVAKWLSRVTPNSIAVSPSASEFRSRVDSRSKDKYEADRVHNHGVVPPLISGTQFTRVEHPDGYRTFDYNFSLFPSTDLLFVNQDMRLKSQKNQVAASDDQYDYIDIKVEYTAACTHGAGQVSLFSPLGTTYLGVGLGLCYFNNHSKGRHATNFLVESSLIRLGHRVFVTKTFFLAVDSKSLFFGRRIYQDQNLSISTAERSSFLLGYYVTDAEGLFARTWLRLFGPDR
jgi:hypothetical protein